MTCFKLFISSLALCFVLGCANKSPQFPSEGIYKGTLIVGFEHSDFTPQGTREKWWLSGNLKEITEKMVASGSMARSELHNPLLIVVEGQLTKLGHYGHLGLYKRELHVTRVLEVQQGAATNK